MADKEGPPGDPTRLPIPSPEEIRRTVERVLSEEPPEEDEGSILRAVVAQTIAQATSGPYPPPQMLAEYKRIDEKVFQEIMDGAKSQREHRQALERLTTERSITRQETANRAQNFCAYASVILAVGLVGVSAFLGREVNWIFPSILVIVGIGGRPAATLAAQAFFRRRTAKNDD